MDDILAVIGSTTQCVYETRRVAYDVVETGKVRAYQALACTAVTFTPAHLSNGGFDTLVRNLIGSKDVVSAARIGALALWLAVAAAVAVSGCNLGKLFKAEGAACVTDGNCPGGEVCCDGRCANGCGAPGTLVVTATLATDYMPGYEFDAVTVDLDGATAGINVSAVTELVNARAITQFSEVRDGSHRLTVTLTLANASIAGRIVTFTTTTDVTVPVQITRDCVDVSCDADAAEQCVGGRCVPYSCSDLQPADCPSAACLSDDDCIAKASCTIGVCISGLCLQRRQDALCGDGERCFPDTGCGTAHHECDVEAQCIDFTSCTQERCSDGLCTSTRDDTRCGTTVCDPTAKAADSSTGCTEAPCSSDNCLPGPCETATCDDGQCKHTSVCQSGELCCSGVCAADCNDPHGCIDRAAGYVCRVAAGTCDIAETCDGVSDVCPPDLYYDATFECRPHQPGDCDIPELCDGISAACPTDVLVAAGAECRPSAGVCDVAEQCTGYATACPVDVYAEDGVSCDPDSCAFCSSGACYGCSNLCDSCNTPGIGESGCAVGVRCQ